MVQAEKRGLEEQVGFYQKQLQGSIAKDVADRLTREAADARTELARLQQLLASGGLPQNQVLKALVSAM